MTAPLGCLQRNHISFKPALPPWKAKAIGGLAAGLHNRVAMVFPECFWRSHGNALADLDQQSRSKGPAETAPLFARLPALDSEDRAGQLLAAH